ncbi:hypothetical protein LTS03_008709 [Exophiala xenobiotica]|nr:hypothetical protein LTR14_011499 [Exophiala xenobiotica]KAK5348145.1 hypothetical protein LTR61_008003 [Exophiala xenobiotica]KAK5365165.1 hypothetical protein LTR11_008575 [Exophiala xenobiotica]KAK5365950.1 hypothetical protein LTS03_008709 [Exophiala xenobiotica]KAK5468943.1 hypothetical protein LTR55_011527 [Exophiala xenobiotica]
MQTLTPQQKFQYPYYPLVNPSIASNAESDPMVGLSYLPSTESVLLHLDGTKVTEKVIGQGATGIIIEQGEYALKLPRISRYTKIDGVPVEVGPLTPKEGDYDERPPLIESIEVEKAIYKRLGDHYGIVRCHNLKSTDVSIQMDLMNGDLRHYLAGNRPERKTQLSWLTKIAHTMAYIHEHRIIIADVRLDNLLLDDTLEVKFCDFGESTLMPLDWDLDGTDDLGFSVLTDIGQFGAAMYEVITGLRCKFDLTQDRKEPENLYTCPRRDSLPSTENIWLGHIIEKCWTQAFKSAKELAAELDQERVP